MNSTTYRDEMDKGKRLVAHAASNVKSYISTVRKDIQEIAVKEKDEGKMESFKNEIVADIKALKDATEDLEYVRRNL